MRFILRSSWGFAAVPVAVSLALSAATVANQPHWQDSAIYLTAVKEFGVLYPPGFVLYLALCKAWTILLSPFADFTLSVHLFSSLCAALTAGVLALTAQRVTGDRAVSAIVGVLAAAGYTWWFSAILAKGYALYFLAASLLLWRMACRDHIRVVLLLGLAWAVHPSAALLGPAVLAYLWRYRTEVRALGARGLAVLFGATTVCAIGPSLLLPAIAARNPAFRLGDPRSVPEWLAYVAGSRFTTIKGVWGFDGIRWLNVGLFAWEEFLAVGLLLVAVGLGVAYRERRRDAWMLLFWIVPIVTVSTLFKIEGQYDFWLVVAWMPLWLAAAVGLARLRARVAWSPAVACLAGLAWAIAANGRDLYFRGNPYAEAFGRSYLRNLDPNSLLVVYSDDAFGLTRYLQSVKRYRTDVRVIHAAYLLPLASLRWHSEDIARRWPDLRPPDFSSVEGHTEDYSNLALSQASIVNAQREGTAPAFFDTEPAAELFRSGSVVPAGFLWKWTRVPNERPDTRYWSYPVSLEEVAGQASRKRGQKLSFSPQGVGTQEEHYERRFVQALVRAGRNQVILVQRQGTPEGFARSVVVCESILKSAPEYWSDPDILYPLATGYYMLNRYDRIPPIVERLLKEGPSPDMKAGGLYYLGEVRRAERKDAEARDLYRQALEAAPENSPLRPRLEELLRRP